MEEPVQFQCNNKRLYGVLHLPDNSTLHRSFVTLVNGGPQPRFGGHRLYVQLARHLCSNGLTVFRFDYEGMGDSEGDLVRFQGAGPSINAAIDFLSSRFANFSNTIIWSLCDGCPISIIYAVQDQSRIGGLIMCNPFVLDERGILAHSLLKHYYLRRFLKKQFWIRLLSFKINIVQELRIIASYIKDVVTWRTKQLIPRNHVENISLRDLVLDGILKFRKSILFILGTEDIVAMEFRNSLLKNKKIEPLLINNRISYYTINNANHTFTQRAKKKELFQVTLHAVYEIEKTLSNKG